MSLKSLTIFIHHQRVSTKNANTPVTPTSKVKVEKAQMQTKYMSLGNPSPEPKKSRDFLSDELKHGLEKQKKEKYCEMKGRTSVNRASYIQTLLESSKSSGDGKLLYLGERHESKEEKIALSTVAEFLTSLRRELVRR
ncbi:hypothetical protein CEXT_263661 [Caerostris extrusa]|uniref:Uncharacterized protein n=1 Tax=Caerostris extrusa TaxID=172846 RepID=A0AAV4W534_CAEEX|nr:hypothetical protein CEXT_263661 [Caerostris extrusa]